MASVPSSPQPLPILPNQHTLTLAELEALAPIHDVDFGVVVQRGMASGHVRKLSVADALRERREREQSRQQQAADRSGERALDPVLVVRSVARHEKGKQKASAASSSVEDAYAAEAGLGPVRPKLKAADSEGKSSVVSFALPSEPSSSSQPATPAPPARLPSHPSRPTTPTRRVDTAPSFSSMGNVVVGADSPSLPATARASSSSVCTSATSYTPLERAPKRGLFSRRSNSSSPTREQRPPPPAERPAANLSRKATGFSAWKSRSPRWAGLTSGAGKSGAVPVPPLPAPPEPTPTPLPRSVLANFRPSALHEGTYPTDFVAPVPESASALGAAHSRSASASAGPPSVITAQPVSSPLVKRGRSGSVGSDRSPTAKLGGLLGKLKSGSTSSPTLHDAAPTRWEGAAARPGQAEDSFGHVSLGRTEVDEEDPPHRGGSKTSLPLDRGGSEGADKRGQGQAAKGFRRVLRRRTASDTNPNEAKAAVASGVWPLKSRRTSSVGVTKDQISGPYPAAGASPGQGESLPTAVVLERRAVHASPSSASLASTVASQSPEKRTLPEPLMPVAALPPGAPRPCDSPTRSALDHLDRVLSGREKPIRRTGFVAGILGDEREVAQPVVPRPTLAAGLSPPRRKPTGREPSGGDAYSPPAPRRRPAASSVAKALSLAHQHGASGGGNGVPILGPIDPPASSDIQPLEDPVYARRHAARGSPKGVPIDPSTWSTISITASEVRKKERRRERREMERREREKELSRLEKRREREDRKGANGSSESLTEALRRAKGSRESMKHTDDDSAVTQEISATASASASPGGGLTHSDSLGSFDSEDSPALPRTPASSSGLRSTGPSFTSSFSNASVSEPPLTDPPHNDLPVRRARRSSLRGPVISTEDDPDARRASISSWSAQLAGHPWLVPHGAEDEDGDATRPSSGSTVTPRDTQRTPTAGPGALRPPSSREKPTLLGLPGLRPPPSLAPSLASQASLASLYQTAYEPTEADEDDDTMPGFSVPGDLSIETVRG